jgi:murein DD-endopeptidase MepM/ murein hydrolase activator NlpD
MPTDKKIAAKKTNRTKKIFAAAVFSVFVFWAFMSVPKIFSYDEIKVKELQDQIKTKNAEMELIEQEIAKYEAEINKNLSEQKTLKNHIYQLQKTSEKLKSQTKLLESQIITADLLIKKLDFEINDKELKIIGQKEALSETIRQLNEEEGKTLIEILLANASLSGFFDNIEQIENFNKEINFKLEDLKSLKISMEKQQADKQTEKENLQNLNAKLTDQKKIAEITKAKNNEILTQTKSKESKYRELLAAQKKKQEALDQEITEFEEQLRIEIDPESLPKAGSGILLWPVSNPVITQYFGNTPFATQNPQVYNGKGHGGVDFRASVGTPIKSSASGSVTGIGDTDKQCKGVSYGKWILIKHNNGLTTLYAHMSLIKVSPGQQVAAGEIIGYSGDTGYVTGPHLHYGVYASQAVQIGTIKSRVCGTNMTLPVSPTNGYLNPLSYL